jgi:hypothetical protein
MPVTWELDFYSRPILDENGKKRWEVVICDSPSDVQADLEQSFRYAKYFSSKAVNSISLKEALTEAMEQSGQKPAQVRFFRRQMNNMVVKACEDMGIAAKASRRTVALANWLDYRYAEVYPQEAGYQATNNPSVQYAIEPPSTLPDALRGESWRFVSLKRDDFNDLDEWDIDFGEFFSLQGLGLDQDTPIPGLLIYSERAKPLAAWMSGLDLAFLTLDEGKRPALVLETGATDRWLLAPLAKPELLEEVKQFEQSKQAAQNIHFIGVQKNAASERFEGFWLLQQLALG